MKGPRPHAVPAAPWNRFLREKTTPTAIGTAGLFRPYNGSNTGFVVGKSAAAASGVALNGITYTYGPWEGCAHKVGLKTSDSWSTGPFELTGSSTRAGNIPVLGEINQFNEDDFWVDLTVRSSIGTRRDSTRTGYPR